MDYKLKQPLLWAVILLSALPIVFAAPPAMNMITQPFTTVFGNQGLGGIYKAAPLFWESVLYLVIFINLALKTPLAKFGKAVPVGMGVALAIGASLLAENRGFRLINEPFVMLLLTALGTLFLYGLLHPKVISNKIPAFAASFALIWTVFAPATILQDPELANIAWVFMFLLSVCWIILIIYMVLGIVKLLSGNKLTRIWDDANPAATTHAHADASHKAEEAVHSVLADAVKSFEKNREEAAKKTAADKAAIEALQQSFRSRLQQIPTNAAHLQGIQDNVSNMNGFVQHVQEQVDAQATNTAFSYDSLKQLIQNEISQLQTAYVKYNNDTAANLQGLIVKDEQQANDTQSNTAKQLEEDEVTRFKKEFDQLNKLGASEQIVQQNLQAIQQAQQSMNKRTLSKEVKAIVDPFNTRAATMLNEYQKHQQLLADAKTRYDTLKNEVQQLEQQKTSGKNHLQALRDLMKARRQSMTQLSQTLTQYHTELTAALAGGDPAQLQQAQARGQQAVMQARDMQANYAQEGTITQALWDEIEKIKTIREPIANQLLALEQESITLLQQQEKLLAEAQAIASVGACAVQAENIMPSRIARTLGVSLGKLGIKNDRSNASKQAAQKLVAENILKFHDDLKAHLGHSVDAEVQAAQQAIMQIEQILLKEYTEYIMFSGGTP